jgi:hypothetical protein
MVLLWLLCGWYAIGLAGAAIACIFDRTQDITVLHVFVALCAALLGPIFFVSVIAQFAKGFFNLVLLSKR